MSSVTNFAVSIYVARTLGAEKFGAFSLAYVTYAFALNASRGLATDPLMVRFSGTDVPTWRRAVASCTGTAAIVGLIIGAFVLAAAAVIGGTAREAFLALGLTLPGLMLQDSWRYSFFALGRGSQAFLNDTIWAVAMLPALVLLRATGHANVFWFVLAWGAAAAVAAAVGPLQARVIPKLSGAWGWVSDHRDLGPRYLAEGVTTASMLQLRGYVVGLVLGLAAVGYVQAAATLMGPITILFLGMTLVAIPEAARVLQRAPQRLPLFCMLVSAGLSAAALGVGGFRADCRAEGTWGLAARLDLAAHISAGAGADAVRRRPGRRGWRRRRPARTGVRPAEPALSRLDFGYLSRLRPGRGVLGRSHRDGARCRGRGLAGRAAAVVAAARGAAGVEPGTCWSPDLVRSADRTASRPRIEPLEPAAGIRAARLA